MLSEVLKGVKTFFLVDYQGLSAEELNRLRTRIRDAGGRMLVAKNTLVNLVLARESVTGLDDLLKGPTALVLIEEDPVASAKVLTDFAKDHAKDLPVSKGGILQGARVEGDAVPRIAKLPSREELLSELVGVLTAPMQQLVGVLQGAPRDFVSVVTNYSEKLKEEE